jgi:hypothetical protein
MDTDRDEAFNNRYGRLDEEDALLTRPAATLGILDTLTDRDAEVLV